MAGSPFLAFLVVLLVALGAVSLGIFLSTFARTKLQIILFALGFGVVAALTIRRDVV